MIVGSLDMLQRIWSLLPSLEKLQRQVAKGKERALDGQLEEVMLTRDDRQQLALAVKVSHLDDCWSNTVQALQPIADLTDHLQRRNTSASDIHNHVQTALQEAKDMSRSDDMYVHTLAHTFTVLIKLQCNS